MPAAQTLHGRLGPRHHDITPSGKVLPCHAAQTIPALSSTMCGTAVSAISGWIDGFPGFRGTAWMREPCRSCEFRELDWGGCRCQALAFTGLRPTPIRPATGRATTPPLRIRQWPSQPRRRRPSRSEGQGPRPAQSDKRRMTVALSEPARPLKSMRSRSVRECGLGVRPHRPCAVAVRQTGGGAWRLPCAVWRPRLFAPPPSPSVRLRSAAGPPPSLSAQGTPSSVGGPEPPVRSRHLRHIACCRSPLSGARAVSQTGHSRP